MMAVSLAVTLVVQEMDANSTRRVWGALDSFRSQVERVSDGYFVDIAPFQLSEEVLHGPMHSKSSPPLARQKSPQPATLQ